MLRRGKVVYHQRLRALLSGERVETAARAVGGGTERQGTVVFPAQPLVEVVGWAAAVVGKLGFQLEAEFLPFRHDVVGFDGADGDRAADARFHPAREGGAFFHGDAAEQGGIKIVAVAHAVVVHPHVDGLFGTIYGNRDAALAGDAADIGRNRAAGGAGVHVIHAVEAFEHVAGGIDPITFEVFLADIGVGDVFAVYVVGAALIGSSAFDFDGFQFGGGRLPAVGGGGVGGGLHVGKGTGQQHDQ